MTAAEGTGRPGLGWSLAAAVTVLSVFAAGNAPAPLYVHWQAAWGFSSGTLTLVFAAYMIALVVTLLFAGGLADRYGRRVVLVPGMAIAVVSCVCLMLAPNVIVLIIGRLCAGVAGGAIVTAGMASVVDLAPADRKTQGSLISSMSMVLGVAAGALIAGGFAALSEHPQWAVFGLMSVLALAGLVISIRLPLRRPPRSDSAAVRRWRPPAPPLGHRRDLVWGIAAFGPGITATGFMLSLAPSVLADVLGEPNPLLAGGLVGLTFICATGIQFALGRLSTRTHLLLSSVAAVGAMALLVLDMTVLRSVAVFVVMAVLAGCAQGLGQLAGYTLIATRIPRERRAESNAVLNIGCYVPAALLPVAAGYLADAMGLAGASVVFGVVVGLAALVAAPSVRVSTRGELRGSREHLRP